MNRQINEKDWKIFREVREGALERFCQLALEAIVKCSKAKGSFHQRYLDAYEMMHEQNKELAAMFDEAARSKALLQLAMLKSRGLIEPEEFARFSLETRNFVYEICGLAKERA